MSDPVSTANLTPEQLADACHEFAEYGDAYIRARDLEDLYGERLWDYLHSDLSATGQVSNQMAESHAHATRMMRAMKALRSVASGGLDRAGEGAGVTDLLRFVAVAEEGASPRTVSPSPAKDQQKAWKRLRIKIQRAEARLRSGRIAELETVDTAARLPILSKNELAVLYAVSMSNRTVTQIEIEGALRNTDTTPTRKTIGKCLRKLRSLRLVHRPDGDTGGEAITTVGREVLKKLQAIGT